MISILSLIEQTGNIYTKKASTHGGEYSGPCPWCGGEDRFSIHPEREHFVCRQCKKAGNAISFMMKFHNQSYFEACASLGIEPTLTIKSPNIATEKPGENEIVWKPREIAFPPKQWQIKAGAFLFEAYKFLLSAHGKQHRNWLNKRGISNDTIKQARMGWNLHSVSFDASTWGLSPEKDKNGRNKQVWIPEGLIIPLFHKQKIIRLRVRQSNPETTNRFIMVKGSAMGFFNYADHIGLDLEERGTKPALITEAELDGWLLHQEAGDLFQVYAIGNSSARPDMAIHENLSQNQILLNLDDDEAGHNEVPWWMSQYPQTQPWFSDFAKDPGEDFECGIDIRNWALSGLKKLKNIASPTVKKSTAQKSFKAQVLSGTEKEKPAVQLVKKTKLKPKSKPNLKTTACVHGKHCSSLKDCICLISKQNPYQSLQCPRDQWYPYHPNNSTVITEIILGPGVRK